VASAESSNDSIYNMSRPTTKKSSLFIFSRRKTIFFSQKVLWRGIEPGLFTPQMLFNG